jgi:hypothetical protein
MGKKRAYSAKPSITSGDRSRASLPGLALLLGMGAGGGPWGPQATGLMPAALGQTPQKPPGQIPCQQTVLKVFVSYLLDRTHVFGTCIIAFLKIIDSQTEVKERKRKVN